MGKQNFTLSKMKLSCLLVAVTFGQNVRQPRDTLSDTTGSILANLAEALGFTGDDAPPPPAENVQDSNQNIVGWVPHPDDNQGEHEGWLTAEEQAAKQPEAEEAVEEE